jgi:hypothetical protein
MRMELSRHEDGGDQRGARHAEADGELLPVAAMVLAALVCDAETSAYTSVFMLVYCMEVKKPRTKAWPTISQIGVWVPTVANDMIIRPTTTVLPTSTLR